MRTFVLVIRWASVVGFFVLVVAVVYGVYLLSRMKRHQDILIGATTRTMTERSEQLATALTELQPKQLKDPACNGD